MSQESVQIYNFASGDNTYPHTGNFTIGVAGQILVNDSDGNDDNIFGDFTHTGGADQPDQLVSSSTVPGINVGDAADLRYKYTVTGSDGSSGTIYFIATNGTTNYGPLFASDFPLVPGVTYTFGTFNTDGAVPYDDLVPCFTAGTLITTNKGEMLIDDLREGDMILTRDNGFQPLRWIGSCKVLAKGKSAPVHIAKGVLNNTADLLVSPNHRMLIDAPVADLYFGERELFVAAKHLLANDGITTKFGGFVTYIHILFDEHEVVVANGAPSESFFPGPTVLDALAMETRDEVLDLFPELRKHASKTFQQTARLCLNKHDAAVLNHLVA
jgi:hypothetical protein